jgi:hypothetical protein
MAVMPNLERPAPNPGYKVKRYGPDDRFRGLWSEFYYLHKEGYTHAVDLNAPCKATFAAITSAANFFHIIYVDSRLVQYVARTCVVGLTNTAGRKAKAEPEQEVEVSLPLDDYEEPQPPA